MQTPVPALLCRCNAGFIRGRLLVEHSKSKSARVLSCSPWKEMTAKAICSWLENGYYRGVMRAEEIQAGQMIETTFGPARVMFVKWYANDPQRKGYFVLEDQTGEPRLVTMFQGETVAAAGNWLEATPVEG